jgi:Integrase zinc binding domain
MVLMHDYHDAVISGHLGVCKSLSNLQKTFTWPKVRRQFTAYVNSCDQCQRNKSSSRAAAGVLQPLEVPKKPWEHLPIDFIVALPPSDGFDAILVVVDNKAMVLVPTVTTVTAKESASLYVDKVYCRHGLARKIISDRDVHFTGAFWQELHKLRLVRVNSVGLGDRRGCDECI